MPTYWSTGFTYLRLTGASTITNIDLKKNGALPTDMFVLHGADGLGAPKLDVSISKGKFQARQPQDRVITLKIGMNPDYSAGETISDIRAYLTSLLTGGAAGPQISVILMNGATERFRTEGYVSSVEDNPWSKDPEAIVTIECLSPYFHDYSPINVISAEGVSTSSPSPSWPNRGSAPAGFYIEVTMNAVYDYFLMYKSANANAKMQFDWFNKFGVHGVSGSKLFINTVEGVRSAAFWRYNGSPGSYTIYDLSTAMTEDSEWLQLHNDTNAFTTNLSSGVTWNFISYLPQHWGI